MQAGPAELSPTQAYEQRISFRFRTALATFGLCLTHPLTQEPELTSHMIASSVFVDKSSAARASFCHPLDLSFALMFRPCLLRSNPSIVLRTSLIMVPWNAMM